MKLEKQIVGKFEKRYKRFFADSILENGELVVSHCPNSGSMKSLMDLENLTYMTFNDDPKRKLKYTLNVMKLENGAFACVNTSLPNKIVYDAIVNGEIPEIKDFDTILREVKYGEENSRIDILCEKGGEKIFIEVKNVTLIEKDSPGIAMFPDAVTDRGAKHLRELAKEVEKGNRAVMFYLVNRTDAESFAVAEHIDKKYKAEFDKAKAAGVEILVYKSKISISGEDNNCEVDIEIDKRLN